MTVLTSFFKHVRLLLISGVVLFVALPIVAANYDGLTFIAQQNEVMVSLKSVQKGASGSFNTINLEYKLGDADWQTYSVSTQQQITIPTIGTALLFRAQSTNANFSSKADASGTFIGYQFVVEGGEVALDGNVMYLLSKDGQGTSVPEYAFPYLFSKCSVTTVAETLLPATTLSKFSYFYMFYDCQSLLNAPALPAPQLTECCYDGMFRGCAKLKVAPKIEATSIEENKTFCCMWMFKNCSELVQGPPSLAPTTLTDGCYYGMFDSCVSLVEAPELKALSHANYCYSEMFKNCKSLKKVKVAFTSWLLGATQNWFNGVETEGTFIAPSELFTDTIRGASTIPTKWTVSKGSCPDGPIISPDTTYASVCEKELPYTWLGHNYDAGTYNDTLSSVLGCDSLVTLVLTISPTYSDTLYDTIYSSIPRQVYDSVHVDSLTNIYGCDSVITQQIHIIYQSTCPDDPIISPDTTYASVCEKELPYTWLGHNYDAGGTYDQTLSSVLGCDSLVTLILTISPTYSDTLYDTIYSSTSRQVYDSVHVDSLTNIYGCDSVIMHLTHFNPISGFVPLFNKKNSTIQINPTLLQPCRTITVNVCEKAYLHFYDLAGKQIAEYSIHEGTNTCSVPCLCGIYNVVITFDSGDNYTCRILIVQ